MKQLIQTQAEDKAQIVKGQIDKYFLGVQGVALRNVVQTMDWGTLLPALLEETPRLGFMKMGVADLQGNAKYSNGTTTSIASRQYFKDALAGKTVISDPLMSTAEKKMVLVIATPIKDGAGKIVGVLTATSDDTFLSKMVSDVSLEETGYAFIINSAGTVIAHPEKTIVEQQQNDIENAKKDSSLASLAAIEKKMAAGETGTGNYTKNGETCEIGYASLKEYGWSLALTVREAEVLKEVNTMRTIIIVGTAVLVLLGLLGIAFLMRKIISKPVSRLASIAKKLAVGETDVEIGKIPNDEIGMLLKAFDSVVASIDRLKRDNAAVAKDITEGRLHKRIDEDGHAGEYGNVVAAINNTLDTLIRHIDTMPSPFLMMDKEMNILYANSAAASLIKDAKERGSGKKCYDILCAGDCGTENCAVMQAMRTGEACTRETTAHPNGQELLVEYTGIPVKDENGEVVGAAEVVTDLTVIKQAQQSAENKSAYQQSEAAKLIVALEKLAAGNLNCEVEAFDAGEELRDEYEVFRLIGENLKKSTDAMKTYIFDISHQLRQLSEGNLTGEVTMAYLGDFAQLKDSINQITASLNKVLTEIHVSARQVANGTWQVSAGSQSISQGATEQASAIEELTSAIAQVAAQTEENAGKAEKANAISAQARQDAVAGSSRLTEMQTAMNDIHETSNSIKKIIKVIDDIAFQTNILALNAAVEAARAGQHGKGFAVVAEEVRNLAQKSAQAAKDTETLIEESIKKVGKGTKTAESTVEALENILTGVENLAQLMGDIAVASGEQAAGIHQINRGIEQISAVVQNNSSISEQTAAASQELSGQAELLKNKVEGFRLKEAKIK
jgi:methyl-accepting chemotaxis protein